MQLLDSFASTESFLLHVSWQLQTTPKACILVAQTLNRERSSYNIYSICSPGPKDCLSLESSCRVRHDFQHWGTLLRSKKAGLVLFKRYRFWESSQINSVFQLVDYNGMLRWWQPAVTSSVRTPVCNDSCSCCPKRSPESCLTET